MVSTLLKNSRVLILGGGGLVGSTIAKHLCRLPREVRPGQLILAALTQEDAERAAEEVLRKSKPPTYGLLPIWGDMFVRQELAYGTSNLLHHDEQDIDRLRRSMMMEDLYGDFDAAYERSQLVATFRQYRPQIVVDCINTATVIAYRNIFDATAKLKESTADLETCKENCNYNTTIDAVLKDSQIAMLAQPTPSLIRHVQILSKVSEEVGLNHYIKIGTTGTGGMGMNIPYTHSENKTCPTLLAKNFTAFGHSGLLMLWSRTPGAPVIQEIKPAAAIGYRDIEVREVKDRYGNSKIRKFKAVDLATAETLNLRESESLSTDDNQEYSEICPLRMNVLDMGENGVFTRDEFMTITAPDQMEMITPEEISEMVVEELIGVATGHNVLAAMSGSLLGPGYRAGIERMKAEARLRNLVCSDNATAPSIALGKLGPPQISKLLFEANLIKDMYGTYKEFMDANPLEAAQAFVAAARETKENEEQPLKTMNTPATQSILNVAPSVGVPVLLEGNILLRGANISVPDVAGHATTIPCPKGHDLEKIAALGWIDLRAQNIAVWKKRVQKIRMSKSNNQHGERSTSVVEDDAIVPFDLAAWVLSVELDGHRDFFVSTQSERDFETAA